MMKQIYLVLTALLLLCLAPMPYGYYMLVRFVAMVVFGIMAYQYYERQKVVASVIFGVLALLFQPIYKISLGRVTWNVIDVLVAVLLIALFVMEKRLERKVQPQFQPLPPNNHQKQNVNSFEFSLKGKLAPKELLYVASEEDKTLTELFETKPEVLEGWGQMIGFHIIYLPLLMKRLKRMEVLKYRAPHLTEAELKETTVGNDFLLQYLENPNDRKRIKQGFIRTEDIHRSGDRDKAINRFYPLSSHSGESIGDQLFRIGKQISLEQQEHQRYLPSCNCPSLSESRSSACQGAVVVNHRATTIDADKQFNSQQEGENINDLMEEVRERIMKLRQRGIAEYILEQLIHPDNRLSRMVITKEYKILLPDYNNMEIKMEPLVKAVYLLFLNHPEGILFKHLPDYREELTQIYDRLRPLGINDRAIQSIEDVTNPLLNSINEKCARIRGAFVGQFDNYMARHYYIDGTRGEAKKISLPRNLVVWE